MARTKSTELNVDFIGGQEPLSQEEQLAISDYFKRQKSKSALRKSSIRSKSQNRIKA
jgi:hypothetical protein